MLKIVALYFFKLRPFAQKFIYIYAAFDCQEQEACYKEAVF